MNNCSRARTRPSTLAVVLCCPTRMPSVYLSFRIFCALAAALRPLCAQHTTHRLGMSRTEGREACAHP
eukprot:scaffold54627_cov33-Tisochrysis_lutea.AAC.3